MFCRKRSNKTKAKVGRKPGKKDGGSTAPEAEASSSAPFVPSTPRTRAAAAKEAAQKARAAAAAKTSEEVIAGPKR